MSAGFLPRSARILLASSCFLLFCRQAAAVTAAAPPTGPAAAPRDWSLAPIRSDKAKLPSGSLIGAIDDEDGEDPAIPLLDDGVSQQDDDVMTAKKGDKQAPSETSKQNPISKSGGGSEKPPPAEFPYPGAHEAAFQPRIPIENDPPPQKNLALPRPSHVNEDGDYVYDESAPKEKPASNGVLPKPSSITEDGDFEYGEPKKPAVPANPIPDVERPVEVEADGYRYFHPKGPETGSASMRFAIMAPPQITNTQTGLTFSNIYGNSPQTALLGDYEWRLLRRFGRIGVKVGSGVSVSTGLGQFVNQQLQATFPAQEQFTFITFPNTVTMSYRFQYADKQILIPFVEAGPGVYTFMETRDDSQPPKFGGAAVAVAAGGIMFSLDSLDRESMRSLDSEYGINHVNFLIEGRGVLGLNSNYNFTSAVANAGIVVDF